MKYIKQQQGFTLVTVLILSSIASVLVLNSLKDNVNQERLSGNFQKSINSRLSSEQGLFETMTAAQDFLATDGNSAATIADVIAELGTITTGYTELTHEGTVYVVELDEESDELVLTSTGNRFEGKSEIKIRLKIVPGTSTSGYSTYADAVVGCEGVSLGGSGTVDSYNSNDGDYDSNSVGTEGTVKTIDKTLGDVVLGGDSPILGDVIATGSIDTQSSDVTGNLHANGDVFIDDGGSVTGYVLAGGNYTQNQSTVGGHVRVAGDVYLKEYGSGSNAIIENNQNEVPLIQYGGTLLGQDASALEGEPYQNVDIEVARIKNSDSTVEGYDPADPDSNCDHLDIGEIVEVISVDVNTPLESFVTRGWNSGYYILTPDNLSLVDSNGTTAQNFDVISSDLLGESVDFVSFSKFEVKSDTLVIDGDVTLFIDGDFTISNNAMIKINEDSSLTIVVTGIFTMDDQRIADETGNNINAAQSLSVYSSYTSDSTYTETNDKITASDAGIIINGVSDLYVTVYAPLADVNILASGAVYGAIRSKTVNVSGNAAIHYDEALRESSETNEGSSGSTLSKLEFVGFEY